MILTHIPTMILTQVPLLLKLRVSIHIANWLYLHWIYHLAAGVLLKIKSSLETLHLLLPSNCWLRLVEVLLAVAHDLREDLVTQFLLAVLA